MCAKAVIAGVQRDLPTHRRRDVETTKKAWTGRAVEEGWHSRAEDTVSAQLPQWAFRRSAGTWRHDPPVRLILMTTYHRLLPGQAREEDDLHQYVK